MSAKFLCVKPRVESFSIDLRQAEWCNLVCVGGLLLIKLIMVSFALLQVDVTLGNGCMISEHMHRYNEMKYLKSTPRLSGLVYKTRRGFHISSKLLWLNHKVWREPPPVFLSNCLEIDCIC